MKLLSLLMLSGVLCALFFHELKMEHRVLSNLKVSDETIKDRLKKVVKPEPMFKSGVLGKYTKLVQPASKGAVTG